MTQLLIGLGLLLALYSLSRLYSHFSDTRPHIQDPNNPRHRFDDL